MNQSIATPFWKSTRFWLALALSLPVYVVLWLLFPVRPAALSWGLLSVCLIYPIIEELLFRGLLQEWLITLSWAARQWLGVSVANLLVSCLFALAHLWQHELLWALSTFFPSLVFGYLRDRYQRLMPAICAHCVYNTGYFALWGG